MIFMFVCKKHDCNSDVRPDRPLATRQIVLQTGSLLSHIDCSLHELRVIFIQNGNEYLSNTVFSLHGMCGGTCHQHHRKL